MLFQNGEHLLAIIQHREARVSSRTSLLPGYSIGVSSFTFSFVIAVLYWYGATLPASGPSLSMRPGQGPWSIKYRHSSLDGRRHSTMTIVSPGGRINHTVYYRESLYSTTGQQPARIHRLWIFMEFLIFSWNQKYFLLFTCTCTCLIFLNNFVTSVFCGFFFKIPDWTAFISKSLYCHHDYFDL